MINPIDRRIYFGTDYDDQRNGEVLKIASNNNMQIMQRREDPFNSDRWGLAI
jgi:hypothetical protein